MTQQLGYGLRHRAGLKEGDVVAIFCTNSIFYPPAMFATQAASLICTFANPSEHLCLLSDCLTADSGHSIYRGRAGVSSPRFKCEIDHYRQRTHAYRQSGYETNGPF